MPRKRIQNSKKNETTFKQLYYDYESSQKANGIKEITLRNYRSHFSVFAKYIDVNQAIDDFCKGDFEKMVLKMQQEGKAHNTIATYIKTIRSFLHWCKNENICDIEVPNIVEIETVKEVYTDEELKLLLAEPPRGCSFTELRNWVIVNFLMNSGCRASTLRNIQIRDVDLSYKQVIYRHNKNGKIQSIPLCSIMIDILKRYMSVRNGLPEEYLFCNQYGDPMTRDALYTAIRHYNLSRGISKTSIHSYRHTFARKYLLDCGGNAFTLQKLLGHSTLEMTRRYCRIYDPDLTKNYDSFSPLERISTKKLPKKH